MIAFIITLLIVGILLYFLNQPEAPIVPWVKWVLNVVAVLFVALYAANLLFGYRFPGSH